MEKVKEFFQNKRNVIICAAALLVVILAIVLVVVFAGGKENKEQKFTAELKEMGKDFYENFYYDLVVNDHGVDAISKFENTGIKVDLDNLGRRAESNKEKDVYKECNKENTKVIIKPKSPYGKADYEMEVELKDCGIDEKKGDK